METKDYTYQDRVKADYKTDFDAKEFTVACAHLLPCGICDKTNKPCPKHCSHRTNFELVEYANDYADVKFDYTTDYSEDNDKYIKE